MANQRADGLDGQLRPDRRRSSGLAGGIGEEMGGGARVTIYVQVPDLQAALDKAASLGGKVLMPPMDVPGGPRIAMFADPEGNTTGLMQG